MIKLHDDVMCVRFPFVEDLSDPRNARHHLTIGKVYRVAMINTDELTGRWLIVLRDDLKRGSYHESNFELVIDGQVVAAPLPAPPPPEDAIGVLQAATG